MILDYTSDTYWQKLPGRTYPQWDGTKWTFDGWADNGITLVPVGTWKNAFRPTRFSIDVNPDFLVGGPLTVTLEDSSNQIIAQITPSIVAPGTYSTAIIAQAEDIAYLNVRSANNSFVYAHATLSGIRFSDADPAFWQDHNGTREADIGVLVKNAQVSYIPGTPGTMADPGRPYLPAYTSYETEVVCRFRAGAGLVQGHFVVWDVNVPSNVPGQSATKVGQSIGFLPTYYDSGTYSCLPETVATFHEEQSYIPPTPAVPATEAQLTQDMNFGWNAGARSIASFGMNGRVVIEAPNPLIGAVVGLASIDETSGYANITHGFYFSGGVAYIIESGSIVMMIDTYGSMDEFDIQRINGVVTYYFGGSPFYVSEVLSEGEVFLKAMLYSGNDSISGVSIGEITVCISEMRPIGARPPGYTELLPLVTNDATRFGKFEPIKSLGYADQAGIPALPALTSIGSDRDYAEGKTVLPALRSSGSSSLLVPSYAIGNTILPLITAAGVGLEHDSLVVEVEMLPLVSGGSDHNHSEGFTSLQPLLSAGYAWPEGYAFMYEQPLMFDAYATRQEGMIVFSDSFEVATLFVGTRETIAEFDTLTEVSDSIETSAVLGARIDTILYVSFSDGTGQVGDDAAVWVVNLATQASTRYENFGFNSFGKWEGAYYGAKSDGLYLLDGDDDNGTPIDAMIAFGVQTFGDTLYKRVPTVYIGARSNGKLLLRVKDADREYLYETRTSSPKLATQRFDIGRGLRLNAFEFELYNQDGDDFELATIEFIPLLTKRKQ